MDREIRRIDRQTEQEKEKGREKDTYAIYVKHFLDRRAPGKNEKREGNSVRE